MKINNISFGAYYKEDSEGYLKKLYSKTQNYKNLENSIKELKEKRPNHELEILKVKFIRGTEENPRVNWRETTRSMWKYLVRNNENGHSTWICTPAKDEHLTQISETLASFSDDVFWHSKEDEEKLYKSLVSPNDKVISDKVIGIPEKPKKMGIVDKIKDFVKFWTFT